MFRASVMDTKGAQLSACGRTVPIGICDFLVIVISNTKTFKCHIYSLHSLLGFLLGAGLPWPC